VFTSGGTEADNLAIKGVLAQHERQHGSAGHLITSAAEHEAVLRPAEALRASGRAVTILDPAAHGAVTAQQVADAIQPETVLVSLMHANNETGVLTPIEEIAAVCGDHDVLLHCDAVQTAGLMALDVNKLGVDLLSISGHKFYGPKGVGVLYVRGGVDLHPVVEGGSQERNRRGGTENVAAVVGCAEALAVAADQATERSRRLRDLQRQLVDGVRDRLGDTVVLNTPLDDIPVAPHVVNIAFPPNEGQPMDGEMLLLNLDMEGVHASAGSACTSGALEPSHVLSTLGLSRETAAAAVRFSMGKDTTEEHVSYVVETLATVVQRMRRR
jgi:cysteine desulfurase